MTRIAILDDYANTAWDAADWSSIEGAEFELFHEHFGHDEDKVAGALAPFDVLVAMRERTPFPASLLAKLPNLKLLVTTGMRNLAIDMQAGRAKGVDICGTDMLPYPAFEHTWALIMALTKKIPLEDRTMKSGGWQKGTGVGLNGKTLGIVGLGKLGAQVARVGKAFEMDVIAWSQNLTQERCDEVGGVALVGKDELFQRADVITVQMILSDRSRGLVGAHEIGLMKPSAYLVNTSRGPIVDEAALLDALQDLRIAGAGIDVYDVEPLPADHPYRKLDNAVLTGHTGYVIAELYEMVYSQAIENIKSWKDGAPTRLLNAE
ncbi:MAG: D-2-hydroxyacid dehydrogenase family protein [Rhodospirillaceae bacterium]|jgi:phosphoglycerate dehydrogenase-like enzyme|nr:D-2-hydroxyacid dehydrogenase family protein [Rhodospirillaceae bacterium]